MKRTEIQNLPEFYAALKQLDAVGRHDSLLAAAKAGMQPIRNAAIEKVPWVTHTLQRSLKVHHVASTNTFAKVALGTNVKYAKRIEYGFEGADSLGRVYHQAAQPYIRPAYDEHRADAVNEARISLIIAIESKVK